MAEGDRRRGGKVAFWPQLEREAGWVDGGGAGLLQEDAHLVEGEGDHVAALGKGTVDGQQKGAVQVAAEGDCGVGHRAGVEARGGVGEVCES